MNPRPTVREIAHILREEAASTIPEGSVYSFAADILLNCGLPLDAPYYPEPPLTSAHGGVWNPQTGEWDMSPSTAGPIDNDWRKPVKAARDSLRMALAPFQSLHSKREAVEDALGELDTFLDTPSSPLGGVNAGTGLQDGAVALSDDDLGRLLFNAMVPENGHSFIAGASTWATWDQLADGSESKERYLAGMRAVRTALAVKPPPTPTPASTAEVGEELAACPFCGETEIQTHMGSFESVFMRCTNCDAEGPSQGGEPAAIAAWNRRASPASATIARLKEALEPFGKWATVIRSDAPDTQAWVSCVTVGDIRRAAQALADLAGEG